MTTTVWTLLRELESNGIQIWLHEGRVRYRRHPALTAERLERLRAVLPEIRAALETDIPAGATASLSLAQEGLWFLEQLDTIGAAYTVLTVAEIDGFVDSNALGLAVRDLIDRHEPLRTRIRNIDGVGTPQIGDWEPGQFTTRDLTGMDQAERAAALGGRVSAHAERRFRIADEVGFAVELVAAGTDRNVLIISAHHLFFDGPSTDIMFRELDAFYRARRDGATPTLPALHGTWSEHVHRERALLTEAQIEADLRYWRDRLGSVPSSPGLPIDQPRPGGAVGRGATLAVEVPAELARALRELARAQGTTLFTVMLAAFHAALAQWTGLYDISVGVPVDGRSAAADDELIGCFVNTVVVRTATSRTSTFAELIDSVSESAMGAFEHRRLPFHRIIADLGASGPHANALFEVMFAYLVQDVYRLGGVPLRLVEPDGPAAKFDLSMFIADPGQANDEALRCTLEYAMPMFERASIELFAARYLTVLTTVAASADVRLGDLPLPPRERQALMTGGEPPLDTEHTLPELIRHRVCAAPTATAVVAGEHELTYRQLDKAAERVAGKLRSLGVGPESLVGVCADRSAELVVGLLGVLIAGAAYVPLDPAYPAERVAYMLSDSGAQVVLTLGDSPFASDVLTIPLEGVLTAEPPWSESGGTDRDAVGPRATPDNAAYVIYTSGSTGLPKGAVLPHRGVVNRIAWQLREVPLGPDDAVLQKTPTSFDVSVWELFLPLVAGARLILAEPGRHGDPVHLNELIDRHHVTTMHFVPSMLRSFLAANEELGAKEPPSLSSLRTVICSGENLPVELVQRFRQTFDCELVNLYGPTEASIDVTIWRCTGTEVNRVPIGRAAPGSATYVLDEALEIVPTGAFGQLYLGGIQLARGYLNRPGRTATSFLPDPFAGHGSRMYRTGDMVRRRTDGALEFIGRADFQLKVRGFRIEPGEVEAVLRQCPAVDDVVVVAREEAPGDQRVVAYAVPAPSATAPSAAKVRAFAAAELPAHMVPSIVHWLSALPLSANGKLDRAALPAPEAVEPGAITQSRRPGTETELALAQVWRDILGVEQVGLDDSFFDLGGHSLLATQVAARVLSRMGVEVPLARFYAQPTLTWLATHVDGADSASSTLAHRMVHEARSRGVEVEVRDGRIFCQGPDTALAEHTQRMLDRHHDPVVAWLADDLRQQAPWVRSFGCSLESARAAIYLLPAAGAGANVYAGWADAVPPDVSVRCLCLPGREQRFDETPYREVGPLAEAVTREVLADLGERPVPFVLVGHSAGALLAYEVARRISDPRLRLLVVAAAPPPDAVGSPDDAEDEQLLDGLRAWGQAAPTLLEDHDAMAMYLPRLRADLAVVASSARVWSEEARVAVPIAAFEGSDDETAKLGTAAAWRRWTQQEFVAQTLPGGHFFPAVDPSTIADRILGIVNLEH